MAKNINQIRNFSELLTNYGVQIPLIQRDYVQGRVHDTKPFEGKGDDKSKELLKKYTKERERRDNFVKQLLDEKLIQNIADIYYLKLEDIASLKKNGQK